MKIKKNMKKRFEEKLPHLVAVVVVYLLKIY